MKRRIQASRYEMKYLVSEAKAAQIRDFVRSYSELDEHFHCGLGYQVCSLYLDSPGMNLYRQTLEGKKNRFKLRMRFYDNEAASPIFLEIKRRENILVKKTRATIGRSSVMDFLAGNDLQPADLFYAQAAASSESDALREFCRLRNRIHAIGTTYVLYTREAYVSPGGNNWRVTFDRGVKTSPFHLSDGKLEVPTNVKRANIHDVVLELKFTDRFPSWMRMLVDEFNLQKTSVPKYIESVDALASRSRFPAFQSLAVNP